LWVLIVIIIAIVFSVFNTQEQVVVTNDTFVCENNNSVNSRVYVFVRGYGDHNPASYDYPKTLISNDPKVQGIMDFDYNETTRLEQLSQNFISGFNEFMSGKQVDEVIIIGHSAGGTIAAYSAHKLDFNGTVEIHTLASPLKGCSYFLIGQGFWADVAPGLGSFTKPGDNVRVYHHKTVNDEVLDQCGPPLEVQNNNVESSKEYYYEEYGHGTIVLAVAETIIDCHK